jgi:hypothetical protein
MVRFAVVLTMMVPLLMPPGMCLCHVVEALEAPIPDQQAEDSASPATACHPCGERQDDDACPANRPKHHAPGCPVVKFLGNQGLAKAETVASVRMLALPRCASGPVPNSLLVFTPPPSSASGLPAVPLYLTLSTLLI